MNTAVECPAKNNWPDGHVYSRQIDQPYPRRCIKCGTPETSDERRTIDRPFTVVATDQDGITFVSHQRPGFPVAGDAIARFRLWHQETFGRPFIGSIVAVFAGRHENLYPDNSVSATKESSDGRTNERGDP